MESPQAAKLSTFAARADGNFYQCKVSGNDPNGVWTKIFHGNPGAGAIGEPSAHFRSGSSDVFVFTRTAGGPLYLRSAPQAFNNSAIAWTWTNLGQPTTASIASDPGSASYNGKEYAFVVGSDQQLHVVSGPAWTWSNQGAPNGVKVMGRPSVVTFDGKLYAFVVGDDGALWVRYWNGAWQWAALGFAPGGVKLIGSPGAVASESDDRIHVFVVGDNFHLFLRYWNGTAWGWRDQGAIGTSMGTPNAAWFHDQGDIDTLRAFMIRRNPAFQPGQPNLPTLYENWYEGSAGWNMTNHGAPADPLPKGRLAINGTFSGAIETWPTWRISAFVKTQSDRVYRRWYGPVDNVWGWQWTPGHCQL
jgi:hypothetical protein